MKNSRPPLTTRPQVLARYAALFWPFILASCADSPSGEEVDTSTSGTAFTGTGSTMAMSTATDSASTSSAGVPDPAAAGHWAKPCLGEPSTLGATASWEVGYLDTEPVDGESVHQILVGRFDTDSWPDVLFTSSRSSGDLGAPVFARLFRGAATGLLGVGASYELQLRDVQYRRYATIDHNRDGVLDLAHRDIIVVADGAGSFAAEIKTRPGDAYSTGDAYADLDGDGDVDLLTASATEPHVLETRLQGADLSFGSPASTACMDERWFDISGPPLRTAIRVAHLDSDALPDVLAMEIPLEAPPAEDAIFSASRVHLFHGQPDGSLLEADEVLESADADDVELADLDCDGQADAVLHERGAGGASIHRRHEGAWLAAQRIELTPLPIGVVTAASAYCLGDFNGDRRYDVALGMSYYTSGQQTAVGIFYGTSSGFTAQPQLLPTKVLDPVELRAGDTNGDGRDELFVADAIGREIEWWQPK